MLESNVIVTPEDGGHPQILFPAESVLLSSQSAAWSGISVERLILSLETPEHHHDAHFLTLHLGAPARMEWKEGNRHLAARALPGEFTIIGAGVSHEVRYEQADVLAISLDPEMVRAAARTAVGGAADQLEFIAQNGAQDRQVERLAMLLKSEIEAGCPSGRLFGEGLGQALAAHLIAHYASFSGARTTRQDASADPTQDPGRLSPRQLSAALDFVEANLSTDIALTDIADAAGLSPYHFARQFKTTVGVAPHAFLIERRIERAKELLARTRLPIAQVAAAVGFAHQSHLTRHFRRLTGSTPARFR